MKCFLSGKLNTMVIGLVTGCDLLSDRCFVELRQIEADIAHNALDRLGEVRAPALVIVGEDDICTPPRYAEELARALSKAELVRIPNAGHCAVFEQPDAVARAVRAFLDAQG